MTASDILERLPRELNLEIMEYTLISFRTFRVSFVFRDRHDMRKYLLSKGIAPVNGPTNPDERDTRGFEVHLYNANLIESSRRQNTCPFSIEIQSIPTALLLVSKGFTENIQRAHNHILKRFLAALQPAILGLNTLDSRFQTKCPGVSKAPELHSLLQNANFIFVGKNIGCGKAILVMPRWVTNNIRSVIVTRHSEPKDSTIFQIEADATGFRNAAVRQSFGALPVVWYSFWIARGGERRKWEVFDGLNSVDSELAGDSFVLAESNDISLIRSRLHITSEKIPRSWLLERGMLIKTSTRWKRAIRFEFDRWA